MQFDASSSTTSSGHTIQKYEWDFDYDGTTFNVDATGIIASHEYHEMKTSGSGSNFTILPYIVALRVEDDNNPVQSDITTNEATLSFENHQPVADAGGTYYTTLINGTPLPVTLFGTRSYDPDSPCDKIVTYKWDTDGDGLFGKDDTDGGLCDGSECEGDSVTIIDNNWMYGQTIQIALQVVDSYGLVSQTSETQVEVRSGDQNPVVIHEIKINDSVDNAIVRGNAPFQFSISLADTAQTLNCEFFIEGQPVTAFDTNNNVMSQIRYDGDNIIQNYDAYFDATQFADGNSYQLEVRITTTDNRQTTKPSRPFSIDNTPPSNPDSCTDEGSESGQCTKDNNPDFYWSGASDNMTIAGYYFYWGTNSTGTATNFTENNNYNPDSLLHNGTYYLRINTIDKAGNEAGWASLYTYKYYNFLHTESDTICDGDSLLWRNNFYKEHGIYHDSLVASCGCDSVYELKLTVNPSPSSFIVTGRDTVMQNQIEIYSVPDDPDLFYTWSVENGVITDQISNDSIEIQWPSPGNGFVYSSAENQFGCKSDTAILLVYTETATKLNALQNDSSITLFPNPAKDHIHINYDKEFTIEILDMQGTIVLISKRSDIDISSLKTGTYIVLIKNSADKLIRKKKIIKY